MHLEDSHNLAWLAVKDSKLKICGGGKKRNIKKPRDDVCHEGQINCIRLWSSPGDLQVSLPGATTALVAQPVIILAAMSG
jgi:hypothetical protein